MKAYEKIQTVQELLSIAEFQFLRRYKKKNPKASKVENQDALSKWYRNKAPRLGTPIDHSYLK